MNFQIILRNGESIDVSCGPGQGRSFTQTLAPHQAVIVQCGSSQLFIQCQPGNVQQTLGPIMLDKNQTLTVECSR
jgi:hypothetical protein